MSTNKDAEWLKNESAKIKDYKWGGDSVVKNGMGEKIDWPGDIRALTSIPIVIHNGNIKIEREIVAFDDHLKI